MKHSLKTDIEHALEAHKENRLLEWTIEHLENEERNRGIAEDIKKRKVVEAKLVKYPLKALKRVEGPQNGEKEPEPIDKWVKRVSGIQKSLEKNIMPPPLIVTDFWEKILISDGNHRHEALLKQGFEDYWTIFILEKHESGKELFHEKN